MKKIILLLLVVLFMSCSVDPNLNEKTFINASSFDLTITPFFQEWQPVTLSSGCEITLYIQEETKMMF